MHQCTHSFDYMVWAKSHPPVKYNLARSGVKDLRLSDLGLEPHNLEICGANAYGHEKLLQAIALRYRIDARQIVLAQGTSFANYLVCAGLLQPGDEAIVEQPAYEVLYKLPRLFHAYVKRLPRRYENGFQIDPDELKRMMSDRVRLIVLTDLHNPSGIKLDPDLLRRIGEIAALHGAHVLMDEVYLESWYDRRPPVAALTSETFITTSSLTKAYGLSGLRCGWIICQAELARQLWRLNDFFGVIGVFISEQIAALAMQRIDAIGAIHREQLADNLDRVANFINGNAALEWIPPDGGTVGFPRITDKVNSQDLAQILRKEYSTSIVPGDFFEMPQHFRLGWGLASDGLEQGLKNIAEALIKQSH
jgi:aspartate/methionine/tyrosine aminotransferase